MRRAQPPTVNLMENMLNKYDFEVKKMKGGFHVFVVSLTAAYNIGD